MSNYKIITDSCANLPNEIVHQHDLDIISLVWIENGVEHLSYDPENGTDFKDFYNRMRNKSIIKTSAINEATFVNRFEKYLSQGTDVLYIAFSSALSTTYNSACLAKNELKEKYPERKIVVIDSLSAALGQGLLVLYACENQEKGINIEDNASWIEQHKLKLTHFFTVEDLVYLHRGGRVSKTSYLLGNALRIKPVLHVDNFGRLIPFAKVIGRKKSIQVLADQMIKHAQNVENQTIAIVHGDCIEDANYLISLLDKKIKYKKIIVNYVDQTIGSHSGPGTLALFSLSDTRDIN